MMKVCIIDWGRERSRERLADVLPGRWRHVEAVAVRAELARAVVGGDGDLLVAAALLHDVGYAPSLAATGFHPLDGARYLRLLGAEDRLCGLVAFHTCARLEAELRALNRELEGEFVDEASVVTDALWWADMTTGPAGELMTPAERIAEIKQRYGPDDVVMRFITEAEPELLAAVARTERRLASAGVQPM
jgi:hypothetical protein